MPGPCSPPADLDRFLAQYRATLVVLSGKAAGMQYVLDQRTIRIGRGPGVDLALDDATVEREHARLTFADGAFHLVDRSQRSDTRVNGGPISRQRLKTSDRLHLGETSLEYELQARPGLLPGRPRR